MFRTYVADFGLKQRIILDNDTTSAHFMISINDDDLCEYDERFWIILNSLNDNCAVPGSPVPVYILDNDGMLIMQIMDDFVKNKLVLLYRYIYLMIDNRYHVLYMHNFSHVDALNNDNNM